MKRLELLAPARDYASAVAAVDAGADAIYIGGARFGARHAAANSVDDIRRAAEYAHLYGVRVHATLNTLLYDDELAAAERQARELVAAGVDALIVQDMALRRMSLPVELHASTQTAIRTPAEAAFLGNAGFARVILERALSLDEIRAICRATTAEVECFVHGAICVGYSGQCYLSRSMSARSGNRGECSQPCRLSYDLEDAAGRRILRGKHLLSVRDLNLADRLGALIDAGVTSFKIEGRLKDEGYIRNVVAYYRRRLDEAIASRGDCRRASVGETRLDFTPDPAKSFTRGESEYFLMGRSAGVASFDTPKSVGEFVGRVAACDVRGFTLDRDAALAAGDGICIGADGTNVNSVEGRRIAPNRMPASIRPGAAVYRNLDSRFRLQLERSRMRRVIPAEACVTVASDRVTFRYTDCEGLSAEASREGVFEPAGDPAKMADGAADAGRPQRRYAVRRTAGGGDGCRVVRSSFAGRFVAARSAGGVAPAARRTGSRTPDSCRRPVCALSCCGAFGRRKCYQPACGTFLPRPRGDAHRAGARPRSLDGGPAGDAFGLLHPSRDRRMPAGRFAPRRRSLSGARREALPAGVRLRTLRNEFDR